LVSKLIQFLLKSTAKVHMSYVRSICDAVRKRTLDLTMASDCRTATSFHLTGERRMNDKAATRGYGEGCRKVVWIGSDPGSRSFNLASVLAGEVRPPGSLDQSSSGDQAGSDAAP
jgi:hypothetical protein